MAAGDMSFGFFLDWEYFALSFLKTDQVSKSGNVFSSMRLITIFNLIFSYVKYKIKPRQIQLKFSNLKHKIYYYLSTQFK